MTNGTILFVLDILEGRNEVAFRTEVLSTQKLRTSFVCLLWLVTKLIYSVWSFVFFSGFN